MKRCGDRSMSVNLTESFGPALMLVDHFVCVFVCERPTEAGVVCEVAVKGFTLGLLAAGSPAATPQADGDVGGVAVAVVRRYVGTWWSGRDGWGVKAVSVQKG